METVCQLAKKKTKIGLSDEGSLPRRLFHTAYCGEQNNDLLFCYPLEGHSFSVGSEDRHAPIVVICNSKQVFLGTAKEHEDGLAVDLVGLTVVDVCADFTHGRYRACRW